MHEYLGSAALRDYDIPLVSHEWYHVFPLLIEAGDSKLDSIIVRRYPDERKELHERWLKTSRTAASPRGTGGCNISPALEATGSETVQRQIEHE